MSIINFNEKFEKCYKDMKLVQKEFIETIKDDLKFKVGDKVKIDVIFESDKDKLLYGNGKIFDIIDIIIFFFCIIIFKFLKAIVIIK